MTALAVAPDPPPLPPPDAGLLSGLPDSVVEEHQDRVRHAHRRSREGWAPEPDTLGERLEALHRRRTGAGRDALLYAREAGGLLLAAKEEIEHGGWMAWVREHAPFSPRTARLYMQIAERWEEVEPKWQRVASLSLRAAVATVSEPREEEPEPKGEGPDPESEWEGVPEFDQQDLRPFKTVKIHCQAEEEFRDLEGRLREDLGIELSKGSGAWWPPRKPRRNSARVWVGGEGPRHPVFVISKGRAEKQITSRYLSRMGVPHRVVVEPEEREAYEGTKTPLAEIVPLPFQDLGRGSIPARNWVWEQAREEGHDWHWIMDDNIQGWYRLHRNRKRLAFTGAIFRAMEDFAERRDNLALAGPNYEQFAPGNEPLPPFIPNTWVYSCLLIRNDLPGIPQPCDRAADSPWPGDGRPQLWRGRYNEDTDLCLRVLKEGWATVRFNAFNANKLPTMTMAGGNTDELYRGDGRLRMAVELAEAHPDVARVGWRWDRPQHEVNYRPFRGNPLGTRPDPSLNGPRDFGMRLVAREEL